MDWRQNGTHTAASRLISPAQASHRHLICPSSENHAFADATVPRYSIERCEQEQGVTWKLTLKFSYQPSPESDWYIGRYTEDFDSKADAELQLLSLKERQLYTRYNPSNPGEHFMDPHRDVFKDEQFPPQRVLKY
jgi:hypothetical protein